ncbi:MAG: hypothetical protein FWC00_06310 [Firmicutes bacterium]|nr:hypothetical protein [Bacillota bacterium]
MDKFTKQKLVEHRAELDELKKLVFRLNVFRQDLPSGVLMTDLYTMLDEIKYLMGYLDCMLEFDATFSFCAHA